MVVAKYLDSGTSHIQVFAVRYIVGFVYFLPFFALSANKPNFTLKTKKIYLHILRAISISFATFFTYMTYRNLNLAVATTVGFTGPLIASAIGILIMREKLNAPKTIALVAGYVGVFLIVQPGIIPFSWYIVTGFAACAFAAIAISLSKQLSHTDSAEKIMMYSTSILALVGCIIVAFQGFMPWDQLKLLLVMGATGTFSQFAYIKAVSLADVSFVSPFEYTRLLLTVPAGYFIFGETLNMGQLAGMVVIVFGSYFLSRS